jgi:hypothetical protein
MNQDFIEILRKLISEQDKETFINHGRCKAFLADYTHGEHKKESRVLLQAIEAGAAKEIDAAEDLALGKKSQIRVLREEYFLAEEVASDVVDMLAVVLRNEPIKQTPTIDYNVQKPIIKPSPPSSTSTPASNTTQTSQPRKNIGRSTTTPIYHLNQPLSNNYKKKSSSRAGIFFAFVVVIIIVIIIIFVVDSNSQNRPTTSTAFPPPRTTTRTQVRFNRGDAVRVRQNARDVNAPHTTLVSWVYRDVLYIGSFCTQGHAILYRSRNYTQQNLVGRFRTTDLIRQ